MIRRDALAARAAAVFARLAGLAGLAGPLLVAVLALAASAGPAAAEPREGSPAVAPPGAPLAPRAPLALDVQVDPTPFFLAGFAPELGLVRGRHRVLVTAVAYDVPGAIEEDDRFEERRRLILAAGYQYFFLGHLRGPFAGATLSTTSSRFTLEGTSMSSDTRTTKVTVRLGWAFAPLRAVPALFLAPWIGPSFSFDPETFTVGGTEIERRRVGVTGAIQLGWRIGL